MINGRTLYWGVLMLIFALSAFLRVGAVTGTVMTKPIRGDAWDYFSYAYNMHEYGVYSKDPSFVNHRRPQRPDSFRSPGYPALLYLFMNPHRLIATINHVLWFQALLSCLTVLIWAYLGYLLMGPMGSLACALMVGISPHLVNSNVYVLTESLFTFQLSVIFLLLYHLFHARGRRLWALAVVLGLVLGAANLTRASLLGWWAVFLPLCLLPPWRRWLPAASLVAVMFLAVNGAWSLRNYAAIGRFSDQTLAAAFVQHGMYPGFMYDDRPESLGIPYDLDPKDGFYKAHPGRVLTAIVHRFESDPLRYLRWYLAGKPIFLYSWNILSAPGDVFVYPVDKTPYAYSALFRLTHAVAYALHWPLVIMGLAGIILIAVPKVRAGLTAEQRWLFGICALFLLYFTGLHIIGSPYPRYGVPIRPIVYFEAIFFLWAVWRRWHASTVPAEAGDEAYERADVHG